MTPKGLYRGEGALATATCPTIGADCVALVDAKPKQEKAMRCFLGFEMAEKSRTEIVPQLTEIHRALKAKGWPLYLTKPEKLHATLLFFPGLAPNDRATLWPDVESAAARGAWSEPGFHWRGLAMWPQPRRPRLVALESDSYPALLHWGLEAWQNHPICLKGQLQLLKSYRPHFTVMRTFANPEDVLTTDQLLEGSEFIRQQLKQIDLQSMQIDRISFFLSDFSQRPHRYIREKTITIH